MHIKVLQDCRYVCFDHAMSLHAFTVAEFYTITFKECNDGLTYNETLVQAPKDMPQNNHLPQEKIHR